MLLAIVLAVLSIWDYPSRQPAHSYLRRQFLAALRTGDTATMEESCRKGVKLLPDDPTWHYNLACSLAYFPKRSQEAFDELEKAIDLGFRNPEMIAKDRDLKRISGELRFEQLVEYAKEMQSRPIMIGPMASVDATGIFGETISLGEQNFRWDFDVGSFVARLKLATGVKLPNTGDLYMNRDNYHSPNGLGAFRSFMSRHPGLTEVKLDAEGKKRKLDINIPNILFPYPVFGNSSTAYTAPKVWRSLPRALVTTRAAELPAIQKMYLGNQVWVFPSNRDTAPVGTNGDVVAAITPYCLMSAGRSWSDLPLVEAALVASASLKPTVKQELVRRGLLAPTIMTLMRKSFGTVRSEDDYTSSRAHPTAIPPHLVDTNRLVKAAAALELNQVPPLAIIRVKTPELEEPPAQPELLYMLPFASAYVIRSEQKVRTFTITAKGAKEFRFVQTHGHDGDVKIAAKDNTAEITLMIDGLSPTNRVDISVFGRNPGTGWGAPSYVCFSRMDPDAPYSDPYLTVLKDPAGK